MKVGDTVWLEDSDPRQPGVKEVTVESVGRKYFTISGQYHSKYLLETGVQVKDWGLPNRVWTSLGQYNEHQLIGKLEFAIRKRLGEYGSLRLNPNQLEQVAAILGVLI